MEHKKKQKTPSIKLPDTVIDLIDLGQLQREVEAIEDLIEQAHVRAPGESLSLPRTTQNLEILVRQSELNMLVDEERQRLAAFLENVRQKAPVIHVSFAAEPSDVFLQKIIAWFRANIHAQTLLQVGLQPSIAAGCVVRTSNKYFDFSLRQHFYKHTDILVKKLAEAKPERAT